MSKLVASAFSISLDGYGAGPNQSLQNPMGENGMELHSWVLGTATFRKTHGMGEGGSTGTDDALGARAMEGLGAWILGRNMFAHSRGPWTDDGWEGWWGEEPPYHVPCFVLTHHARAPLAMKGGTTFEFVTDGIHAALERARAVAGGKNIRVGGGASTVRQYLEARLLDELHLAISPVLLGRGEPLFQGLDWRALGYRCKEVVPGEKATHVFITK